MRFVTPGAAPCAALLLSEIRRVKSSNITRRYLGTILDVLQSFPAELVRDQLEVLAGDPAFSAKMRRRFRLCALDADGGASAG